LTNIQPIQQLELLWFSLNSFEAQETTKALHYSCGFYYSLYKCVNTVQYFFQNYFKLDVFDKLDSSNTYTTSFQFWFFFDYIFRLSNLYLIHMHRVNLKETFDSVKGPYLTTQKLKWWMITKVISGNLSFIFKGFLLLHSLWYSVPKDLVSLSWIG
jgi:hypothetical protein